MHVALVGNDRDSLFEGFVSNRANTRATPVGSLATKRHERQRRASAREPDCGARRDPVPHCGGTS